MTVKLLALVAVPPDVVTLIGPVVAPLGRVVAIEVDEFTVKLAATPLKVTDVARSEERRVGKERVPPGPRDEEKKVIGGRGMSVTVVAPLAGPHVGTTEIG